MAEPPTEEEAEVSVPEMHWYRLVGKVLGKLYMSERGPRHRTRVIVQGRATEWELLDDMEVSTREKRMR